MPNLRQNKTNASCNQVQELGFAESRPPEAPDSLDIVKSKQRHGYRCIDRPWWVKVI